MITVVRLATEIYAAYCLESGFLIQGGRLSIARALRGIGIPPSHITTILHDLEYPAEDLVYIPLFHAHALRPKIRTRHC